MGAGYSRVKTWIAGETLTAADLNAEFNNEINNDITNKLTAQGDILYATAAATAAALAKGGILNPGAWAAGGIGGLISGSTLGTSGYDTGQYSSTDGGVDSGTGGDFGDTSGSGSEGGEGSPVNPAANVLDPNKTGETTPPTTTGGTEMGIKKESYLDVLAKMSQDYYNKTAPARENILQRGQNFLEGGLDVTQSPMWASGKNAAEVLYKRAQDDTRANLPSGGALQSSLAEGDTNKARTLTDLASQIGTDEYNKIFSIAQGSPAVAMSGLGTAAGQQANMSGQASQLQAALAGIAATTAGQQMYKNVQEDAQKNQLYGDLGSGLGEGIGAGLEKG
uniref:Uncharacterized protein n=1 Tax=viral metagenome TaxID=1070528 RepID=A0A6M3L8R4_9ZZZZ